MSFRSLIQRYEKHYATFLGKDAATGGAEQVVGGDFVTVGALEYFILKANGLTDNMLVVDVGCGTGRLAQQLAVRGHQRYAGFDIAPAAVEYARKLCDRPTWQFKVTEGIKIDLPDETADVVCFFSVFTHFPHEHTFLYLQETKRLLKRGGTVVFTFLEFAIPSHWTMFESAVRDFFADGEPIVFLDRHAIESFSRTLGYELVSFQDGDKPTVPIPEPLTWADGRVMTGTGNLGQSICVLRKV